MKILNNQQEKSKDENNSDEQEEKNNENDENNGYKLVKLGSDVRIGNINDTSWWISLCFLSAVALATRLSYLSYLPGTTWDEVHFGKFASHYINRTFYYDVHPPLGKIFIAVASYVTGYRGNFNFTEGNFYDDTIRYQLIRSEMGILGALLVPLSFLTVYEVTFSLGAATLGALGVLCDTFLHKINALILLDPVLNFMICCCVFCTFRFYNMKDKEYSREWWEWLFLTGVSLGLVTSIKYIGIFTVAFVGLHTAYQLYEIACDKKQTVWHIILHTMARVLCLIILPIIIYLSGFILHLTILSETEPNSGAFLHTRFLATLNNTEYDNKTFPKFLNYGANITIQSSSLHVGYLDSWYDLFPSELTAPCQVVSVITIRDPDGTVWKMKPVDINKGTVIETSNPTQPPLVVRNGDWIMLTHLGTQRSLRSHGRRAPFTRRLYQVCGYGDDGEGGPFETWQILVPGIPIGEPLQVFNHDFMLKNYKMHCYLSASDVSLPEAWAHEGSKEVACTKNPKYSGLLWHINWIDSEKVIGETTAKEHRMGLGERILQLHRIMFDINAGLKRDETDIITDEEDYTTSRPWMWPIVYQMQLLGSYSDEPDVPIKWFSIASFNPVIAYTNILTLVLFLIILVGHFFKLMRNHEEPVFVKDRRTNTVWACLWILLCWGVHYLPFFFMSRSLYLHHYCPAYIYSCLITGIILNYLCEVASELASKKFKSNILKKDHLLTIPALLFIVSYICLYPLATYVEGEMFSNSTSVNAYLDKLYLGQRWFPFGYNMDEQIEMSGMRVTSSLIPIDMSNIDNPHINATLYYENVDLNTTKPLFVEHGHIRPVSASNFTSTLTAITENKDDIADNNKNLSINASVIDNASIVDDTKNDPAVDNEKGAVDGRLNAPVEASSTMF
ncbi:UNVERIFIED_CONTAM: hypothetical protein RMT77_012592 [Armadillidium vulgare]